MMIELGELPSTGTAPDDDLPAPRPNRLAVRKAALVVVALACLLGVTGSTRPEPHGVRPLWSIAEVDGYGTTLTADTLYSPQPAGTRTRLTAYELATGKTRWSRLTDDPNTTLTEAPGTGLLLMPGDKKTVTISEENGSYSTEFSTTTTALNAATGESLWTVPGDVQTVWQDTALMADYTDQGAVRRLRLIRLTDHGTVWTRDTPGIQSQGVGQAGDRPDRIVTASATGEIVVTRFADGSPIAAGRVAWDPTEPVEGVWNELVPIGDHLLINRSRGDRVNVAVYRMDTMALLWQRSTSGGYPFACGRSVCLNEGNHVTSYDTATGRPRWQVAGGFNAWQPSEGRLVLENGTGDGRQLLIDVENGAQVGEGVTGNAMWNWTVSHSDSLLLMGPTTTPPNRTSVRVWDLRTGRTHLLGSIDYLAEYRCQTVVHYLACSNGGKLEVTAVG